MQYHKLKFPLLVLNWFVEIRDGERESVLAVLHILHTQRVQTMPLLYKTEETEIFKPIPMWQSVYCLQQNTKTFIALCPSCILATCTCPMLTLTACFVILNVCNILSATFLIYM